MAWTKVKTAIVVGTGLLLAAGTTTVIVQGEFLPVREPSYQGRSLLEWLADIGYDQPPEKRTKAAEAIRAMGTKTVPFLINDLIADPRLPRHRVRYLKPDTRDIDQRSGQATWAFDALDPLGKAAIPELNQLLQQNSGYVPGALAGIGRDALPSLFKALTNGNLWVRDNTAAYLANAIYSEKILPIEAAAALPIAVRNLQDTNINIRWRAASLLAAMTLQPDFSVPALVDGLEDSVTTVACQCAQALGRFGVEGIAAVPALLKAAGSTNAELSCASAEALSLIDPNAFSRIVLAKVVSLTTNANETVRMRAIQVLGRIGPDAKEAVPALILRLGDRNDVVRMVAAQSLGMIAQRPDEAIPALRLCLQDASRVVRIEAVNAIGRFGPAARSAVPALIEAAKANPNLKGNVRIALSRIDRDAAAGFR